MKPLKDFKRETLCANIKNIASIISVKYKRENDKFV
jgi:hypothetical protein